MIFIANYDLLDICKSLLFTKQPY